ncbi:hypothetical protein SAG0122_03535 [Streptococcus agalactiae STIR-CD-09]|nr:hypothetical protein SAG0122_03535 [Streptococcus agalactiae STIR-CD-09]
MYNVFFISNILKINSILVYPNIKKKNMTLRHCLPKVRHKKNTPGEF